MKSLVFDIEANGLHPDLIHCMSYDEEGTVRSVYKYEDVKEVLESADVLIGHNIVSYDLPVLRKLAQVNPTARIVDTLALSWYLYPHLPRHGLADWGVTFGTAKVEIDDWEGLTREEYIHRCEVDVDINTQLWLRLWYCLKRLYGNEEDAWRLIDYLTFKMQCVEDQEAVGWKLDVKRCEKLLKKLVAEREEKVRALVLVMPKVAITVSKTRPKKCFKQDTSRSALGEAWFKLLEEHSLPEDYSGEVVVVKGYDEPNPGSSTQVKAWLHGLGWRPETFDYKRDKDTGKVRKVEQVRADYGEGKELCKSVKRLITTTNGVDVLEGLTILDHRIPMLNGMLNNVDENGIIRAGMGGFTNTLRLKHRVLVNLPGVDKLYGIDIRGCLICPEGYVLVGSDMSSLEDRTKQHYMWPHDPEYVREMQTPDFDPHINLAEFAGALTHDEVERHKSGEHPQKAIRRLYKTANYACVYGAGGPTVARGAGCTDREGTKLVEAYWKRNWSVNAIAEEQKVKTCGGQKWLFNPVSRLWYSLRHEKDRFSTLNQGTGVWCFDNWVKHVKSRKLPIVGQFHDEIIALVKEENKERAAGVMRWAIEQTNKELKLNRELDIDTQYGYNYAEIH